MKQGEDAFLKRRREIDQDVAAADEIDLREWRIARDILFGEDAQIANRTADSISSFLLREEPTQAIGRHIRRDAVEVHAGARLQDRRLVDVGCIQLDRRRVWQLVEKLCQANRE